MKALGDRDPERYTTVIEAHVAERVDEFCFKNRISSSGFLRQLVHEWDKAQQMERMEWEEREFQERRRAKKEKLASEDELRQAIADGLLSAEEAGLRE